MFVMFFLVNDMTKVIFSHFKVIFKHILSQVDEMSKQNKLNNLVHNVFCPPIQSIFFLPNIRCHDIFFLFQFNNIWDKRFEFLTFWSKVFDLTNLDVITLIKVTNHPLQFNTNSIFSCKLSCKLFINSIKRRASYIHFSKALSQNFYSLNYKYCKLYVMSFNRSVVLCDSLSQ